MPVQRIPRYVLLLQNLVKHTPKEQKDYPQLLEALAKMKMVAEHINEKKRDADAIAKVNEIERALSGKFIDPVLNCPRNLTQPQRRFVHQGTVQVRESKGLLVRHLILFNDVVLETKIHSKSAAHSLQSSKNTGYKLLSTASLIEASVAAESADDLGFLFTTTKKVFACTCTSVKARDEWVAKLRKAILQLRDLQESIHSRHATNDLL
eukprot:TRINITY_DN6595_c0_g1_i2.p1 TRINITY_DN6595_c0_g1~~TRINITY_DN6595_c0_g1_i2.p1  ORF type:complete len:208 (-),score=71.80 TRINITY_DN6595_c0_g1_i2:82-705(-)